MNNKQKSAELLNKALIRKQKKHSQYSQRSFAKDLKVSSAYISHLLKGRQLPNINRIDEIARLLELDIMEKSRLAQLIVFDGSEKIENLTLEKTNDVLQRKQIEIALEKILSSWLHIALLEGLTLTPPHNNIKNLQKKLKISSSQIEKSLELLLQSQLIEKTENNFRKTHQHLYIPSGRSRSIIRNYHNQWITKAKENLNQKTSAQDFNNRLITGFTFAMNPKKLDQLKIKITNFLNELSQDASASDCTEVYQCNVQFFPVTQTDE